MLYSSHTRLALNNSRHSAANKPVEILDFTISQRKWNFFDFFGVRGKLKSNEKVQMLPFAVLNEKYRVCVFIVKSIWILPIIEFSNLLAPFHSASARINLCWRVKSVRKRETNEEKAEDYQRERGSSIFGVKNKRRSGVEAARKIRHNHSTHVNAKANKIKPVVFAFST